MLIYTEVDLPLTSTERHIIAAQGMLAQNKSDDADKKWPQKTVSFSSVSLLKRLLLCLKIDPLNIAEIAVHHG